MTWYRLAALAFAGLTLATQALAAAGVAFVTDLRGEASLEGARIGLMAELAEGNKLSLAPKSTVVVMFVQSGDEFALTGPGEYSLTAREVVAAKTGGVTKRGTAWRPDLGKVVDISRTATASLRMRSAALSITKPGAGLTNLVPDHTRTTQLSPVLLWPAMPGATKYAVALTQDGTPVHAGSSPTPSYKLPIKLVPETTYTWTVSAGDKQVSARFSTLSTDEIRQAVAAKPASKAPFSDQLLYAMLLQNMGATHEARELWKILSAQRPDLPELAALAR